MGSAERLKARADFLAFAKKAGGLPTSAMATRSSGVPKGALWVMSPWYGVLELVGEPSMSPNIECWDGYNIVYVVTETLQPLTDEAADLLGVPRGRRVWDQRRVEAWEAEPIDWPWGNLD